MTARVILHRDRTFHAFSMCPKPQQSAANQVRGGRTE